MKFGLLHFGGYYYTGVVHTIMPQYCTVIYYSYVAMHITYACIAINTYPYTYIYSYNLYSIQLYLMLGFSADPYNFDDPVKGNRVYFTNDYYKNECKVLVYYSSTTRIVCITR